MTLAETQRLFYAALTRADQVDAAQVEACFRGSAPLSATERLDIYAGMYLIRLLDVLRDDFPKLGALLGGGAFTELATAYVRAYPSRNPDLGMLALHFERFLRERPLSRPDLADLAALEWARSEVFLEAAAPPIGREAFATLDAVAFEAARLRLVPALRLLELNHDVGMLWQALERGEPPGPPVARATAIAVWRPELQSLHLELEPSEALALRRALDGATLGEVCAAFERHESPAAAAFEALGSWADEGWIAAIEPPGS